MTLKTLEIFYTLSKYDHMGKSAEVLGITQSAVSLAIKSLEKEVGERLFDRLGKRVVLNDCGRRFYNETIESYSRLLEAKNMFRKGKISGELIIASSKSWGNFLMPRKIISFLKRYPNVQISHVIKNSSQILKDILNGKIDLGIIESEIDDYDLIKEKIGEDRLIVVSKDDSLKKGEYFIDELFKKKWILREKGSGTREMFLSAIGDMKKHLEIFSECSEFEEIKNFLLSDNDIITCISEFAFNEEIKRGELFEIRVKNLDLKRNYYLIYHKNKYQSSLFKKFASFLRND